MLRFKNPQVEHEFWDVLTKHIVRYAALWLTEYCWREFGKHVTVTDILRPDTGQPSAHPDGLAFDFRAHYEQLTPQQQQALPHVDKCFIAEERTKIEKDFTAVFKRVDGLKVLWFHGDNLEFHGHVQFASTAKVIYKAA